MNFAADPHLPQLRLALEHQKADRLGEAEAIYRHILRLAPKHAMALQLLGVLLGKTNRAAEGAKCLRKSVTLQPGDPMAWNNLANALKSLGQFTEALQATDRALALNPGYGMAHCTRANVLMQLQQRPAALQAYDAALHFAPGLPDALVGKAIVCLALDQPATALALADQALTAQPEAPESLLVRALSLHQLKRYREAIDACLKVQKLVPGHMEALMCLVWSRAAVCEWHDAAADEQTLAHKIMWEGKVPSTPFALLGIYDDPALQRKAAEAHLAFANPAPKVARPPLSASPKIRLAYVSADLHRHATAFLMAELFELHDRSRFEVLGVSLSPSDHSDMRARLEKSFDRFIDVQALNDAEVADLMRREQVDIAIDLKGLTTDSRPGIFQHRPAPLIVNYIGYPGTLASEVYDYIIGDAVVTPFHHADHFSEAIVQMPHSYQVNDRQRRIAEQTPTRADVGLPPQGFVFACFNNNYKIRPEVFDVWMRLLKAIDGSVLWLLGDSDEVVANLKQATQERGVDPARVVFAPRVDLPEHLARHRLADLFLDTLPCNAHTTTSDALWAGLPVLTCLGQAFAGRVAASLLTAVGLPELITHDLAAYEARALELARDTAQLAALKQRLNEQRVQAPLFDTPRFTRDLEAAYAHMVQRHRQGLAPAPFAVAELNA